METDYLGSDSGFFRDIASTTPDPALPLGDYGLPDPTTDYFNGVVSSKSGDVKSGDDIRNAAPYAIDRPARVNLAISIPRWRGAYDPYLGGRKVPEFPPESTDSGGLQSHGQLPDNVIRNTARIEFRDWDTNLVWGIEEMHPNLVDHFGIINTAGR